MYAVVAPHIVPALRRVQAGIAEYLCTLLHSLLKLDRKGKQRCLREIQRLKPSMRERDIHRALWLAMIPALACGNFGQQFANQFAGSGSIFKMKKEISAKRKTVASQYKSLDIGFVQLTH